jgi:hypothetical protein
MFAAQMTTFTIIDALTFLPIMRTIEILALVEIVVGALRFFPFHDSAAARMKGKFLRFVWTQPGFALCCLLWAHIAWAIGLHIIWLAFGHPEMLECVAGNNGL